MQKININSHLRTQVSKRQKKDSLLISSQVYQQLVHWLRDSLLISNLLKNEGSFRSVYCVSESETKFTRDILELPLFKDQLELTRLIYRVKIPKRLHIKVARDAISAIKEKSHVRFIKK